MVGRVGTVTAALSAGRVAARPLRPGHCGSTADSATAASPPWGRGGTGSDRRALCPRLDALPTPDTFPPQGASPAAPRPGPTTACKGWTNGGVDRCRFRVTRKRSRSRPADRHAGPMSRDTTSGPRGAGPRGAIHPGRLSERPKACYLTTARGRWVSGLNQWIANPPSPFRGSEGSNPSLPAILQSPPMLLGAFRNGNFPLLPVTRAPETLCKHVGTTVDRK